MAAAVDDFTGRTNIMNPATAAIAVTPSDTVNLGHVSRALWVGSTGDVTVIMADGGAAVTFSAVPVGWMPLRVSRVNATSTTASSIVAVW